MNRKIKKEISKKEYDEFIDKLLKINENEGKLPEYIEYEDIKLFKIEYIETIENVNKFIIENGRHPEKITFYLQKHNR